MMKRLRLYEVWTDEETFWVIARAEVNAVVMVIEDKTIPVTHDDITKVVELYPEDMWHVNFKEDDGLTETNLLSYFKLYEGDGEIVSSTAYRD